MIFEDSLLLIALIFGFYAAWNIGANDVSNAMGTSVGSKALTLRKAVIIAALFEFCGAVFFGSNVSDTLRQGIINASYFSDHPHILVNGMLSALLACGIWLHVATYFGLPVSTTHAIVGAIVGFGAIVGGTEAIYWDKVCNIGASWIISPLMGAIFSFAIFFFLRKRIFYSHNPLEATKKALPWLVSGMLIVLSVVCGQTSLIAPFALLCGAGTYLACRYLKVPALAVASIHQEQTNSEYFWVERIFGFLQIVSACLMAFSHGANDVSNAIGPLAAIVSILETGSTTFQTTIPHWILLVGGIGIVVGLATWGWRVIETIGNKITELSPSRGFSAEFGTALTVLIASRLGLPISTTHTLVGAVLGVGLAGGIAALNLRVMRDIIFAWIVTIPAGATLSVFCYFILESLL